MPCLLKRFWTFSVPDRHSTSAFETYFVHEISIIPQKPTSPLLISAPWFCWWSAIPNRPIKQNWTKVIFKYCRCGNVLVLAMFTVFMQRTLSIFQNTDIAVPILPWMSLSLFEAVVTALVKDVQQSTCCYMPSILMMLDSGAFWFVMATNTTIFCAFISVLLYLFFTFLYNAFPRRSSTFSLPSRE